MAYEFTAWCLCELFTAEMISAANLLDAACDLHIAGIYRALALGRMLQLPRTAAELVSELNFVDSAHVALQAMLVRLANRTGVVSVAEDGGTLRFRAVAEPPDTAGALDEIRAQMADLGDAYSAALEFLDFGAENFVVALRDDPDFMDRILSGRDPKYSELWFRATNTDPLQEVHGIMVARAVEKLFDKGTVLEIGGGTGNGTRHVLQALARHNSLDSVDKYVFTDISTRFVMESRHEFSNDYPDASFEWRFLDINSPFAPQKIPAESADLILGVNAAHVAKDIVRFLKQCRETLRPNGMIMFGERVRINPMEMAPRELTLNLSAYHRTAAELNAEYRPVHCYLSPDNWLRVLELAGFKHIRILPDLDDVGQVFPNQYAAVVIAEK